MTGGDIDYVSQMFTPTLNVLQSLMDTLLAADIGTDCYMTCIITRQVKQQRSNLPQLIAKTS